MHVEDDEKRKQSRLRPKGMEEGSLLEQALRHGLEQHSSIETGEFTKNVLIIDVYSLEKILDDTIKELQELAKLAYQCNAYLQNKNFRWHHGGDGPVFGVHVGEEKVPHLRAYCRYGPNIADEWMAIQFMWEMSTDMDRDIAISCWDVEDGQVMFIQAAEALPEWLDRDSTDRHRYGCWIRSGRLHIIPEPHASLQYALSWMRSQDRRGSPSFPQIESILQRSFSENQKDALVEQRIPLVLPRKVAFLIRRRPDLIHTAIQSFCDHVEDPIPDLLEHSDWVWSTTTVSRTNYAMLRTVVSQAVWESPDFVPRCGVEVERYKRQCKMESNPHLRHAVRLGTRIVVGLEFLGKMKDEPMSVDRRITSWTSIADESQRTGGSSKILESFQQGPNNALYDLSDLLKCPVFPDESERLALFTHPDVSMKQQLLNAQKKVDEDEEFPMPLSNQSDDDTWLILDEKGEIHGATDLDSVLKRFQKFMIQPSDYEGVETKKQRTRKEIRPHVFLNILHAALKDDNLSFPSTDDAFFFQEDYDLIDDDPDDDDDDVDQDAPEGDDDEKEASMMRQIMVSFVHLVILVHAIFMIVVSHIKTIHFRPQDAMDTELQQKTQSRELDRVEDVPIDETGESHRQISEDVHVLSNLLQSLEASAGEAGPVPNLLKGMDS